MTSITRDLRKDLEKTVKQARRIAEAGARQAVQQLRVGDGDAPKDLTTDQRALRTRLRAHGRQLGDRRDAKTGTQDIARLVRESAYEHWHRMLFARFLAETDLLIEPESGVAITLDEVRELALEKSTDWLEMASDYAERMLPQIFRKDDPVLEIPLPPETRSEMEDLLKGLSKQLFEADDSLGWVYQFWQADKKDEINESEAKIGADELPAVTQLFTEDYMVLFLLHNTLGAWWAGKFLEAHPDLASSAVSEDEIRAACSVGTIKWDYLRFIRENADHDSSGRWRIAAGPFETWPRAAKDLTVLDPCMGSGHFLVFALPILVAFRMAEESLSREAAVDAVLRDNIFGLEIDSRCTQIAAFNLAFAAWRIAGYRVLPRLNLACSGLAVGVTKSEWLKLAERAVLAADPATKRDLLGVEENLLTAGLEARVKNGLEALFELFVKAPLLGSLIDPRRPTGDIFRADFGQLAPLLASILTAAESDEMAEMAVAAQGIAKAAEILARRHTLVITNVPYLMRTKQQQPLVEFLEEYYAESNTDLATCFIDRCIDLSDHLGSAAVVTQQAMLFLRSYKVQRKRLLSQNTWQFVVRLGPRAFETISGERVDVMMLCISRQSPNEAHELAIYDATASRAALSKSVSIREGDFAYSLQAAQYSNPDAVVKFSSIGATALLGRYASCYQGTSPGDGARLVLKFWEVPTESKDWDFFQGPPGLTGLYRGREQIVHSRSLDGGFPSAAIRGRDAWQRQGVAIGQMTHLPATLYSGELFSNSTPVIIPNSPDYRGAIWAFCKSEHFFQELRKLNPKLSVDNGYVGKIPFDLQVWKAIAESEYPSGLPKPYTDDPTQWLFSGQVQTSTQPLQVAVARLLGYRWPRQRGSVFADCSPLGPDGLEKYEPADGIVCISAIKGAPPADERLTALLADALGAEWSAARLAGLLNDVGFAGRTLEDWLRDGFFQQHCEVFHHRPFVWHVWDGRRDGFHALINYSRLSASAGEGRRTIEKLIYTYLGDWIDRQRVDQKAGVEGADGRLAAAEHLRDELIKIRDGEPPYDIFVRWKPLHMQPIGWDPDINDGVRINIRPFMNARPLGARGANACVLRTTPKNVKWDKDRGKEPIRDKLDYPWFWAWDETSEDFLGSKEFDGNRWNDLHYSHTVKQFARDRHRAPAGGKF